MLLLRRQATERINELRASKLVRVGYGHSLNHLRQHGSACQRRSAAISQESRGLNLFIINPQTQSQAISADGICFFGAGVRLCQLAGVARMGDVIFELLRVSQNYFAARDLCDRGESARRLSTAR